MVPKHNYIYGFEDYNIVALGDSYFRNTCSDYLPYGFFDNSGGNYIINQGLPYDIDSVPSTYNYYDFVVFHPELCYNHPELLDTAKKVYTHPSCKLSRSMMQEKYKKSLNPYLSDAVIIPNPNFDNFRLWDVAIFVNENAKLVGKVTLDEDNEDVIKKMKDAELGTKMRDLVTCPIKDRYNFYHTQHLMDAELVFVGQVLYIPNDQMWAMDILINKIPTDKIVFESSVQESLGTETNKLDFDSLVSICDMLNSSDQDNVSAGLKALSMMDWMHYPNSIKYMLNQVNNRLNWVYNKAMNATSVKFMFKTISKVRNRNHLPGNYDEEIYEQDYELFKQLKMHYDKVAPEKILNYMRFMPFMTVNQCMIVPKLR